MNFSVEPGPKMGFVNRGRAPATSMCYHESGLYLFVASQKESSLRIVDCLNGCPPNDRPSLIKLQTKGIHTLQCTHHDKCVLFSGSNDHHKNTIHYLSVHDNKILREWTGHTGQVTGISVSPVDDTFLSSSADGTVKLWDIGQSGNPLGEMRLPPNVEGSPIAAFDSTGLVFGISAKMAGDEGHYIQLYDARNSSSPFSEMKVQRQELEQKAQLSGSTPERAYALSKNEWTSMEFNKSGKQILFSSKGALISVDGYEGTVLHTFLAESDGNNVPSLPMAGCFAPDDNSVLCGNENGTISCYNANTGLLVRKLRGHVGRVECISANPKYAQFASACTNTALWIW